MANTQVDLLLGRIAVHNKFLEESQLQEALRVHDGNGGKHLGMTLVELGYISPKQCEALVKATQKHMEKKGDTPSPAPATTAQPHTTPAEGGDGDDLGRTTKRVTFDPANAEATFVPELLRQARKMLASDLHLSCGAVPFIRLNGDLKYFELPPLEAEFSKNAILAILSEEERQRFMDRLDLDTCIHLQGIGRFRTNVLMQRHGVSAVFRIIKDRVPTLDELGMPKVLERFTTYNQGLVLVTGPAGSGKSSTLAALIERINQTRKDHIITLEDPVEYIFECKKANITQRQVELHTQSWSNALRASLREDPDVIMVGEMRDLDTVSLAITAAETGHLVLATLHTTNATRTVDRVLDVFPPREQAQIRAMVSESLRGVVSQQLIPRSDGKGRVPALEILFWTPAVGHLIRERRTFQLFSILQTGKHLGMQLMDDSLAQLVSAGTVTRDEAALHATNPNLFLGS